ncbi:MAG: hypothetical protein ACREYC_28775 [Gammaproteobacteria bacterium]
MAIRAHLGKELIGKTLSNRSPKPTSVPAIEGLAVDLAEIRQRAT